MLWIDHVAGRYDQTLGTGSAQLPRLRPARPPSATWQHIAATYDGATARFYVDGTQVASKTFTGNVGDSNVWRIGAYGATRRSASSTA